MTVITYYQSTKKMKNPKPKLQAFLPTSPPGENKKKVISGTSIPMITELGEWKDLSSCCQFFCHQLLYFYKLKLLIFYIFSALFLNRVDVVKNNSFFRCPKGL